MITASETAAYLTDFYTGAAKAEADDALNRQNPEVGAAQTISDIVEGKLSPRTVDRIADAAGRSKQDRAVQGSLSRRFPLGQTFGN